MKPRIYKNEVKQSFGVNSTYERDHHAERPFLFFRKLPKPFCFAPNIVLGSEGVQRGFRGGWLGVGWASDPLNP